jgi:hypothetical protein
MPKFKIKAAPKCTVCKKSAYPAERVDIFGISVHTLCFNCTTCAKKLTLSGAAWNTDTKLLYCKTHFADQLRTNDGARFAQSAKNVAAKMIAEKEKRAPGSSRKAALSMDQGNLLDEDLKAIRDAGYDRALEVQIGAWIEDVSGMQLSERGEKFSESLSDGVVLCHFMNRLKPGSVPKVQDSSQPFKQMENIKYFLVAVRNEFHLLESEMFGTLDLREEANLNQVLDTFSTIHRKCGADDALRDFVNNHQLTFADMSSAVTAKKKELNKAREAKAHAKHVDAEKKRKQKDEEEKKRKEEDAAKEENAAKARAKAAVSAPAAPATKATAVPATPTSASAPPSRKLNPNGQWYMLIGEENHGPYTTNEMTAWFADGAVAPECWVSVDGGEWKQAKDLLSGGGGGGSISADAAGPSSAGVSQGDPMLNPNGQWYMLIGEDNHGPYTTDEISTWFADGAVAPDCWVSLDGGEWKQAKDLLSGGGAGGGGSNSGGGVSESNETAKDEWYMLVGEEQHGPYSLAELQGWVAEGAVDGGTYVSNGGDWVMAKDAR